MGINAGLLLAATEDEWVFPKESAFFRRYRDQGNTEELLPEAEDPFFTNDLLGVVAMRNRGQLT